MKFIMNSANGDLIRLSNAVKKTRVSLRMTPAALRDRSIYRKPSEQRRIAEKQRMANARQKTKPNRRAKQRIEASKTPL